MEFHMLQKILMLAGCVLILLAGCARKVTVESVMENPQLMEGRYTYQWMQPDRGKETGGRIYNQVVDESVKQAVQAQLEKRGYRLASSGNADLRVSWFGGIESKIKVESIEHFYASQGYGTLSAAMPGQVAKGATSRSYEEGTIMINILDSQKHQRIWQGRGADRIRKGMNADDARLYVERVVKAIFSDFPSASPRKQGNKE